MTKGAIGECIRWLASGLGRVQRDRRFEFNQHGGSREKKEDEKEDHVYVQARRKGYAVGVRSPEKGLSSSKGSVPEQEKEKKEKEEEEEEEEKEEKEVTLAGRWPRLTDAPRRHGMSISTDTRAPRDGNADYCGPILHLLLLASSLPSSSIFTIRGDATREKTTRRREDKLVLPFKFVWNNPVVYYSRSSKSSSELKASTRVYADQSNRRESNSPFEKSSTLLLSLFQDKSGGFLLVNPHRHEVSFNIVFTVRIYVRENSHKAAERTINRNGSV
ncbi:hypothetical protein V1477_000916 [Vespula maculifrons]|uniref:Uncharacterized protein n=1 Tax=Vespula maculifrons TaxID=7453 RepID=A0ABD2D345_VESMC